MKKSIYCYKKDENIVRQYLKKWGVNFKERNGVFKVDNIECKAVSERLSEKLIIHITS